MFKRELGETATIECSGEEGMIIGRADYANQTVHDYRIRYTAADGRATEQWWPEDSLK